MQQMWKVRKKLRLEIQDFKRSAGSRVKCAGYYAAVPDVCGSRSQTPGPEGACRAGGSRHTAVEIMNK
jgi:hypothetical protein